MNSVELREEENESINLENTIYYRSLWETQYIWHRKD